MENDTVELKNFMVLMPQLLQYLTWTLSWSPPHPPHQHLITNYSSSTSSDLSMPFSYTNALDNLNDKPTDDA